MDKEFGRELSALVKEMRAENAALKVICTVLIAEVAMLHKEPAANLDRITASLRGVAEGASLLGQTEGLDTRSLTHAIEGLCQAADRLLQR
jgi:hypothetical protein